MAVSTTHYALDRGIGSTQLVLDMWKAQATAIDNDVIASSKECPVLQGIENPASTLSSVGGQCFTTVPLYPLAKDVNFLFQNYINLQIHLSVNLHTADVTTAAAQPGAGVMCAVYFPSTTVIPSRLQLLCGNTSIWSNTFHRQEARLTAASLPNAIVDKNCDYFHLGKLLKHQAFPGVILPITIAAGNHTHEIDLNLNIDLNQLTPLLSNIPFTTHEMGELRLRLFFEDLEKALCYTIFNTTSENTILNYGYIEAMPFGQPFRFAHATNANEGTDFTPILTSWQIKNLQIVQSCFSIREESKMEILKYIQQDNRITIPSQTWSTSLSTSKPNSNQGEIIFQTSAYNVNTLAFLFPMSKSQVVHPNPIFKYIDVKFNSKTVNYIPYTASDNRLVKDTIQALINDDCYGANVNLLDSIKPQYLNTYTANSNMNDFKMPDNAVGVQLKTLRRDPNNFCIAFGLSPVNCFEKGFNMASANPGSTQIRVRYESESRRDDVYSTATANRHSHSPISSNYGTLSATAESNPLCLCLCDCCIVLEFNPVVGRCQSGSIVYAEPTLA